MGDVNLPVRRDPQHRVLAGVCAGLARRWGVDANLLRIALVVLCFSSGLGLILYGIGLALIPRAGSSEPPVRRALPFTRTWNAPTLVLATIAAGVVVFGVLGGWSGIGIFPLLVVGGIWYLATGRRRRGNTPPAEPTPYERAALAWRERLVQQESTAASPQLVADAPRALDPAPLPDQVGPRWTVAATPPEPETSAAPVVRRRRSLWWPTLGLAAVGVTVVGIAGAPHPWPAFAGAVALALGIGLVLASPRGRPRLMLPAAIVAVVVAAGALAVPAGSEALAGAGTRTSFAAVADLPEAVHADVGRHVYDLTALTPTTEATTRFSVDAGTLVLVLPEDANSEVIWQVDAGSFTSPEHSAGGFDLSGVETHTPHPGGPVLHIVASTDVGNLEVIRR
jgi:phage shock protein PspC (stress-responsive transcriptional regulator)